MTTSATANNQWYYTNNSCTNIYCIGSPNSFTSGSQNISLPLNTCYQQFNSIGTGTNLFIETIANIDNNFIYYVDLLIDRPYLMPDELIDSVEQLLAIDRAKKLVHELLPEDIISQIESEKGIWVQSKLKPNRKFHFKHNERIGVYDNDVLKGMLCIQPKDSFVPDDVLLAKLALLFLDEKRLVETARWW